MAGVVELSVSEAGVAPLDGKPAQAAGSLVGETSRLGGDRRPGLSCSNLLPKHRENQLAPQMHCTCPSCPEHGEKSKIPDSPGKRKLEEFKRRSALYQININMARSFGLEA